MTHPVDFVVFIHFLSGYDINMDYCDQFLPSSRGPTSLYESLRQTSIYYNSFTTLLIKLHPFFHLLSSKRVLVVGLVLVSLTSEESGLACL
jgi:hypothetical protein